MKKWTENEEYYLDLCRENNSIISGTIFQHRDINMATLKLHNNNKRVRVEGVITFLTQGLLRQHSILLSQARNHSLFSFPKGAFRTVYDLPNTGDDLMSIHSNLVSTAPVSRNLFPVCQNSTQSPN